jgi:hypothetical protein
LEFYGIVGSANTLVKSYLKDRYQRVIVEDNLTQANSTSDLGKIKHGVLQGSILSPLLLLFYTNDLTKVVNMISQHIWPIPHTYIHAYNGAIIFATSRILPKLSPVMKLHYCQSKLVCKVMLTVDRFTSKLLCPLCFSTVQYSAR